LSRRPRIPGTRGGKALFVLPEIHDDDPVELKNALAIRNSCATEGRCRGCGVIGEVRPDVEHANIFHYVFEHEHWCPALTDEAA
jgi:hypothetical protein